MGAAEQAPPQYLAVRDGEQTLGSLRAPPLAVRPGDTTLLICLDRWGFKECDFQQPSVIVSVRDLQGRPLEAVQETPFAPRITANYVIFEMAIYIQTPINRLPPDAAIFFEFMHYKVKKKKRSCKAYCYMEKDEFSRAGPVSLEVYKKPAQYNRKGKRPSLLTVKQLFLHVENRLQERL